MFKCYWEPNMCHCPSDWGYNKIGHQTIKIQFATGQKGSLEVRKQKVIMKPGTRGAGRAGMSVGVLNQPQDTELLRDGGAEPASGRCKDQSKELGEMLLDPTSDLSEPTSLTFQPIKAVTPTLLSLCSVPGWRRREIRRERKDAPAPFSRTGQFSGWIFQHAHNLATWVDKCWSHTQNTVYPSRLKAIHPANWWINSVKMANSFIHAANCYFF